MEHLVTGYFVDYQRSTMTPEEGRAVAGASKSSETAAGTKARGAMRKRHGERLQGEREKRLHRRLCSYVYIYVDINLCKHLFMYGYI